MLSKMLSLALLLLGITYAHDANGSLPVVDLGYELYRASEYNLAGNYYNFSNIRYAAPPLGELRFKAPQPPVVNRSLIRDGLDGHICPQASPSWLLTSYEWTTPYITSGAMPNNSLSTIDLSNSSVPTVRDPLESEDCLFLDVIVPRTAFERVGKGYGAPVLVNIHGGGYTAGSKLDGSPVSLISRSLNESVDGMIYVSLNYRLGAFGFLSGPTFQESGLGNAGLYDQRKALEWVQENIQLFGGDKNRVTVVGASAGAGSLLQQVTAFGGSSLAPFKQAIFQSSGVFSVPSMHTQEETFQSFLTAAGVSSLSEARTLSSSQLIHANALQVARSPYGLFTFTPAIDGTFVTQDPKWLLKHGRYDPSINVLVGRNTNEGLGFCPPAVNDAEYRDFLRFTFPSAVDSVINYIADSLYPAVYDGTMPYRDPIARAALTVTEYLFTCNAVALDRAYGNRSHGYLFGVPPGLHGQDSSYVHYDPSSSAVNETIAYAMQDYIISLVVRGIPDSLVDGLPYFPSYAENGTVLNITNDGIVPGVTSEGMAERCEWWQLQLYV